MYDKILLRVGSRGGWMEVRVVVPRLKGENENTGRREDAELVLSVRCVGGDIRPAAAAGTY